MTRLRKYPINPKAYLGRCHLVFSMFYFAAKCTVTGDHVNTLDDDHYQHSGTCPYVFVQKKDDANELKIVSQAMLCSYTDKRTCALKVIVSFKVGSKGYRFVFIPMNNCVKKSTDDNTLEEELCYSYFDADYSLTIKNMYTSLVVKQLGIKMFYKKGR